MKAVLKIVGVLTIAIVLVSIVISTIHYLLVYAVMGILALIGLAFLVRWLIGHNELNATTPRLQDTRRTERSADGELKHLERKIGSKP